MVLRPTLGYNDMKHNLVVHGVELTEVNPVRGLRRSHDVEGFDYLDCYHPSR